MDAVARTLSRAWWRAGRHWWRATASALAVVLVVTLGTAGTLAGMQAESQQRVADFYTGQARLTPSVPGAAPPGTFASDAAGLQATLQDIEQATAGRAEPRVESTALLSRRPLLQAVVFGEDQFGAAVPGAAADSEAYLVGILVGVELATPAIRHRLQPYLLAGDFPTAGDGSSIELLVSMRQLERTLTAEERSDLEGRPEALLGLRLETTAAHLDASGRDVLRLPGRVVGVYDSGLDALDDATVLVDIADARRLVAQDPAAGYANVITVHGAARSAEQLAHERSWSIEGAAAFTQRYAGQLLNVLRWAAALATGTLIVVPAGMLWLGLAQQMERNRREIAVCRAIGVPVGSLAGCLSRLAVGVLVRGVLPAALIVAGLALLARQPLAWQAPAPLGFALPLPTLLTVVLLVLAAGAAAVLGTAAAMRRMDLAGTLRAL